MRENFLRTLEREEPAVIKGAEYLGQKVVEASGDIVSVVENLGGIRIEPARATGWLTRRYGYEGSPRWNGDQGYIYCIGVGGGDITNGLSQEQVFTVAHELAHLFLLELGVPVHQSSEEYWFLEDICDRIAKRLLSLED